MDKIQQIDDLNWAADVLKQNNLPASKKLNKKTINKKCSLRALTMCHTAESGRSGFKSDPGGLCMSFSLSLALSLFKTTFFLKSVPWTGTVCTCIKKQISADSSLSLSSLGWTQAPSSWAMVCLRELWAAAHSRIRLTVTSCSSRRWS